MISRQLIETSQNESIYLLQEYKGEENITIVDIYIYTEDGKW